MAMEGNAKGNGITQNNKGHRNRSKMKGKVKTRKQ